MAFPTIEGTAITDTIAGSINKIVNLPASIQSGETLLVFLRAALGGTAFSFPAGWTVLFDDVSDASDDRTALAWRKADGTEGSTITVTHNQSCKHAALAWRISGAADPTVTSPQSALAVGTSTTPDPPSLTPTGGTKDYLWLAVAGMEAYGVSTYPANYTLSQISAAGTGGADPNLNLGVAGAGRNLNAASENPGTFTFVASENWTAATVAVHPVEAVTATHGWSSQIISVAAMLAAGLAEWVRA